MFCCFVALVLVAALFVNAAMLKVKAFLTNRVVVTGVAATMLVLLATVPYLWLSYH